MIERLMKINKYKEAFHEQPNLIGIAAVAAAALGTVSVLPLIVGVVAEAAYMLFVPDSGWYEKRLATKHDSEISAKRQQLKDRVWPKLSEDMKDRFRRLERVREDINDQPGMADEQWFREVLRKLDYLLDKFLDFSLKDIQFREYLKTAVDRVQEAGGKIEYGYDKKGRRSLTMEESIRTIETFYDAELADITNQVEKAADDPGTQAIISKRHEVMKRRRDFVSKIGKIIINLGHQLELLEDTFGLIGDEILARTPEQVLADIEDVVSQTNIMTNLLEDIAPYEKSISQL
jgi:hypothetical protein